MTSEFLQLLPPYRALQTLLAHFDAALKVEQVTLLTALGRVLAENIAAPEALPAFARSSVDGYALRAADSYGASESLPAYLKVAQEVLMGQAALTPIRPGECALIHTGGMLPPGADGVVMIEHTQRTLEDEVELLRAIGVGENTLQVGEDVLAGEQVFVRGQVLTPAVIGALAAMGLYSVPVFRRPRVGIISSGDELVAPMESARPGQVRDINSYTLYNLVLQFGGAPQLYGIVRDAPQAFLSTAQQALAESDLVVFTAGSSVSVRDLTAQTIQALGAPGILVHGLQIRPGKPTIMAVCAGKPVIGLPGNPVSAFVIAGLFVPPVMQKLSGQTTLPRRPAVLARLLANIPSQAGREDWVPVVLHGSDGAWEAEPVYGKSGLIFTLARADALVRVPADANGLAAGSDVLAYFM